MLRLTLLLSLAWVLLLGAPALSQPRHLYLTWEESDTSTTQTIVFQTTDRATNPRVEVRLDPNSEKVSTRTAKTVMITGLGRRIHWVTLKDLKPATSYHFRAGDDRFGLSKWRSFRTLPDDDRPLTIAAGGDMFWYEATVTLSRIAARQKPDVAVLGGDIAYADGKLENVGFWDRWFDNWEELMNPADGPMVGIISAIGNHEVRGFFGQSRNNAPFYFAFLPQGGDPYFHRRLGSEIALTILDSNHVTTHQAQVPFLEQSLKAAFDDKVPYQLVSYHVPNYPTQAIFNGPQAVEGRKHWVPLFDRYRVSVALEHHDHVFKRTHPLKNNKIDSDGTVYLGDGAWGMPTRKIPEVRWYHAKTSSTNHFWILKNQKNGLECQAFGLDGKVFDSVIIGPRWSKADRVP